MERRIANFMDVHFFKFSIIKKPAKDVSTVPVTVRVSGIIDHSKAKFLRRRTSNTEKEDLKKMFGEFMPMHVHTKKLAAANEEKLQMGNSNQVITHYRHT